MKEIKMQVAHNKHVFIPKLYRRLAAITQTELTGIRRLVSLRSLTPTDESTLRKLLMTMERKTDRYLRQNLQNPSKPGEASLNRMVKKFERKVGRPPAHVSQRSDCFRAAHGCVEKANAINVLLQAALGEKSSIGAVLISGPVISHTAATIKIKTNFGEKTLLIHGHGVKGSDEAEDLPSFKKGLREAIRDPEHRLFWFADTLGLTHLKNPAKYFKTKTALITIKPRAFSALVKANIGYFYKQTGEKRKALAYFLESLKQLPEYSSTHHEIGETYLSLNERRKAVNYFKRAVRLFPYRLDSLYALAETDGNGKAKHLHTIEKNFSNPSEIFRKSGDACHEVSDYEGARAFYLKALRLDPNNDAAKSMLQSLDQPKSILQSLDQL